MGKTLTGTFATRREVELAVEHLVQEYGVERADIFIEPRSDENSAGVKGASRDAGSDRPAAQMDPDATFNGALLVSVDLNEDETSDVRKVFKDLGATAVAER